MNLTVEFRLYTRLYKGILENRLGLWTSRTGLIVRLEDLDTGRKGYGEIAPFPGFRSETYDQAFAFVNRLCYPIGKPHPPVITEETIAGIPEHLTATRFGLGCALAHLSAPEDSSPENLFLMADHPQAALLPRGSQALEAWPAYWEAGYRTFKWKIGLMDPDREISLLDKLLSALPPEAKLGLDANGNLTLAQAQEWLNACDPQRIEFLEQPLDPEQKEDLLQLAQESPIPLALDESVSTLADLQEWAPQWPGVFVLKVPLLGFVDQTRSFLSDLRTQGQPLDLVFSSVLETSIARKTALALAQEFHNPKRAMGFGVQAWFDLEDGFEDPNPDRIWEHLS
jgi:o-succinylbenzoate synthase